MRIAADTNALVRIAIQDDVRQMRKAQRALEGAELVAISTPALCEFAWVMTKGCKQPTALVAAGIRYFLAAANVETDRNAVEAGLAMLDAGGDFADGVIAYEGRALGAQMFVSFDKKAVAHLEQQVKATLLL